MTYRLLAAPKDSGVKYWELPVLFDDYEFSRAGGSDAKLKDWIRLGYVRPAKDKEAKAKRSFYTPTAKIAGLPRRIRTKLYQMEVVSIAWLLQFGNKSNASNRITPLLKKVAMHSTTPPPVCFVLEKPLRSLLTKEANRKDPWEPRGKFVDLKGRCALTGFFTDNVVKNNYYLNLDG